MKMKKRRWENISFYDHTGLEKHLSKMAKKGWLIEKISKFFWTYRKIQPQDIHFCVTYFPDASEFDPEPSEEQQTFYDFCAHTGWQLACTWHQMQVFYNEKANPIPLETDPITKVDTLHKAFKRNYLPSHYLILSLSLLQMFLRAAVFLLDPIDFLSDPFNFLQIITCLSLLTLSAVELLTYFIWHKKADRAAQNGAFVDTPSTRIFQISLFMLFLTAVACWIVNLFTSGNLIFIWLVVFSSIGVFATLICASIIKYGLKKVKASKELSIAAIVTVTSLLTATVIIALSLGLISANRNGIFDNNPNSPPLCISDLIEIDKNDYTTKNENQQTIFVGNQVVRQKPDKDIQNSSEMPDLQYTLATVNMPFLYDFCKKQMFREQDDSDNKNIPVQLQNLYESVDAHPWGAVEAYRLTASDGAKTNCYLLCYEKSIVEIQFSWEPSSEQMAIVGQKFAS